jgi:tetratricopeptide (TPR) repeat protein
VNHEEAQVKVSILLVAIASAGGDWRQARAEPQEKNANEQAAGETKNSTQPAEDKPGPKAGEGERGAGLSDLEKALRIKENRKEARDILEKFKAGGEKDLKLLEEYTALHRKNTEIAPETCPKCWAEYGEALSMLGFKFWSDSQDLLDQIKKAEHPPTEDLQVKAKELTAKWAEHFKKSNQSYETYFRLADTQSIHPYAYERVMRHWELLGNYERALSYLEKCVKAHPSMQGGLDRSMREKFDKLRRIYNQEIQKGAKAKAEEKNPPVIPSDHR